MQDRTFGIAVVGAGEMGCCHMTNAAQVPGLTVRAVADVDPARAKQQAERFGAAVWSRDYREIVARSDVDVVFVCVPTAVHAEVAIEAARQGKDVFCEKPLALTWETGRRMARAIQQSGVTFGINFCHRFQKCFHELRRLMGEPDIGRPAYYGIEDCAEVRPKTAMHCRALNGGPIFDMMCHWVDMWRFVFDSEPRRVFARGSIFAAGKPRVAGVDDLAIDTAAVTVEFASGDVGCYRVCWGLPEGTPGSSRHVVLAPNARMEVEQFSRIAVARGAETEIVSDLATDIQLEQIKDFAACLGNRGRPRTSIADGLAALRVSLAALESIRSGEAITLGDERITPQEPGLIKKTAE